jgi:hypothetical protein
MSDLAWLLGLLIILAVTLFAMFTLPLMMAVYGATEAQCVRYSSSELIIIASGYGQDFGGCDWLVDKLLWNNSGFKVDQYDFSPSNGYSYRYESFVLTK